MNQPKCWFVSIGMLCAIGYLLVAVMMFRLLLKDANACFQER